MNSIQNFEKKCLFTFSIPSCTLNKAATQQQQSTHLIVGKETVYQLVGQRRRHPGHKQYRPQDQLIPGLGFRFRFRVYV
jgi:hypothetical protein